MATTAECPLSRRIGLAGRELLPCLQGWRQLAGRLLHSSYVAAFQIPRLPEAVWCLFLTRLYEKAAGRRVNDDAVRGLALNRSNFFPSGNVPPPTPIRILVNVVAHLLQRLPCGP
jgi:hypothetical protein